MSTQPPPTPQAVLSAHGLLTLRGEISRENIHPLIDAILTHNLAGDVDALRLHLDSPGGSVDAGFALIDIMNWSRIPISTTAIGFVASMALLVFMAGTKGQRTVMPHCSLMSHRFAAMSAGNHADLLAARVQQDVLHQRILDHYRDCTGAESDALVEAELLRPTDRWLTPHEAVTLGIADRMWSPGIVEEGQA